MLRAIHLTATCVAMLIATSGQVQEWIIIPTGVQNVVEYSTVVNDWGWSVLYRGDYGASGIPISSIFSGAGDYLMLAAIQGGSSKIEVLAATLTSDMLTSSSKDTTHTANDVEWYYNGGSMGFAGLEDTIVQNNADINYSTSFGPQPAERDRLSWHTGGGYGSSPTTLDGGWRAGTFDFLNSSTDWDRIVFTLSAAPAAVPEPSSLTLFGIGACVVGLGAARRRRRVSQQEATA